MGRTLVIERYGHLTTVNKTKCIRVRPLDLPDRDLKGGQIASEGPGFKDRQEKAVREKLAYLKMKIENGDSAPIGPASPKPFPLSEKEGMVSDQKVHKKPLQIPPARKIVYTADDVKPGEMVVVHLPSKKGRYLGEVRRVWLPTAEAPRIPKDGFASTYGDGLDHRRPRLPHGGSMEEAVPPEEGCPSRGTLGRYIRFLAKTSSSSL